MSDLVDRYRNVGDEWTEVGALLDSRPAWHAEAACRTAPASITWFPGTGEKSTMAEAVCAGCPVLNVCRAWATAQGPELKGVWGGLSERARRRQRNKS